MRSFLTLALFLALAATPALFAQTGLAVPELASLDRDIPALLSANHIPGGAVAIVKDGRLVFARGYGYAESATSQAFQPDSLCRIGSISKTFTLTNNNIRVIYSVRVPAGVLFVPKTVNGNVTAGLPDSAISATTVNGRIVLSTTQPTDAHLVNGTILATLGDTAWEDSRAFSAVNGTIDLEVPASLHASVRASNIWGSLTNDFSIPVHRNLVGSWFEGSLNGGGPRLLLTTVNGSIHLRQLPVE